MILDQLKQVRNWWDNKALVLMYHRVADLLFDPFELAVSPENFEQQLQVLKKNYKLISVNQLIDQIQKRTISANSVCVTFDDGYWDNYVNAMPLLEKYQCNATFYIASEFLEKSKPFWWDELQFILLNTPKLPSNLSIKINGELFESNLENDGVLTKEEWTRQRRWLFTESPVTQRCELFTAVWTRMKPLPFAEQQNVLQKLKAWASFLPRFSEMDNLPVTELQLETIVCNPLFDAGVHTSTHPSLPLNNLEMQQTEITGCKEYLEKKYRKKMHTISYPYGDYNDVTLGIVKEQQLAGAFTTDEWIVTKRTDPVSIGRFGVKNQPGPEFQAQLSKWFRKK